MDHHTVMDLDKLLSVDAGPSEVPGLARTYALGVPGPLIVEVTVTRRDPASPEFFVMEQGDAEAQEAAKIAVLSVLGYYHKLYEDFWAFRRSPLNACPDVWAVTSDLCFAVDCIGGDPRGPSLGAAVAACTMSALFRVSLFAKLGLTGQVSIHNRSIVDAALVR